MVHQEYYWQSDDSVRLYGQSWMPDHRPRAVINYIHGFKDHGSRFEKWATRFAGNGIGVMAVDLRGHGRSDGRRGYAAGFGSYLKDVRVLRQQTLHMYGDVPHFLYGHSLGGNIVTNYLISGDLLPGAAVITSPWFALSAPTPLFKMIMARIVRYLLPGVTVKSDLDAAGLSHDPAVIRDYCSDPLVHNAILPRLFFEIADQGLKASRSIYKINMPILVMHGSDDPITSVKHTRDFVMNAGAMTAYREWPGAYHELHNELQEEEVFEVVLQWMNLRLQDKT